METDRLSVPVETLLRVGTVTVRPTTTLRGAAMVMADECKGTVLVEDPTGVVGIISERDITGALAEGCDPDQDRVQQYMSDRLATVDVAAPAAEAVRLMTAHQIRHLVVTEDGEPVGVLSSRDLLALVLPPLATAPGT